MRALWTSAAIAAATGGEADGSFAATGVTFDSREVEPGDLFVALKGAASDGHRYIDQALSMGAAGLLVSEGGITGPQVRVADTQAGLEALGRAARARLSPEAIVIGVTGSAGKTSVKEALRETFARIGPTHASVKSYNNQTGVPLSLARMPTDTRWGVFEMGMNHAGEIARLTRQVRPHIAVITAILPAHIENFGGLDGIADAKAEIFEGIAPGGIGVLNADAPHFDRLQAAAARAGARVLSFGIDAEATVRARDLIESADGSSFTVDLAGATHRVRVPLPGRPRVVNALALIATVHAAGVDPACAVDALVTLEAMPGRGLWRTIALPGGGDARLIDESYNANPAAMAAAIAVLGAAHTPGRKLVVIGAMRELGAPTPEYHAALVPALIDADVAYAVLVGEETRAMAARFAASTWVADWQAALAALRETLAPGDLVLIKGSNSVGLGHLVAALAEPAADAPPEV